MSEPLRVLAPTEQQATIQDWVASAAVRVHWLPQAQLLQAAAEFDAVLLPVAGPQALADLAETGAVAKLAAASAVLVLHRKAIAVSSAEGLQAQLGLQLQAEAALIAQGAQAVLMVSESSVSPASPAHSEVTPAVAHGLGPAAGASMGGSMGPAMQLRQAVLRWKAQRSRMLAYATDVNTGLPHEAQLLEHASQLLALRERQPAPLVIIALRVEGLTRAAERLGGEASNVLRRKVAVRLRAGLRASDVVAAIGPDSFAVLLAHVDSASDGQRVASKLVKALQQPFNVAGQVCAVAAAVGVAHAPEHGRDARLLLQRASAQAEGLATLGEADSQPQAPRLASLVQLPRTGGPAANDGDNRGSGPASSTRAESAERGG